ncbi:NADPH dehydrogenase NamA [Caldibacillus lycopersici]|uniref:NADPH dehydrogenase n=1 Tax=Perspicuibacillus lycopersici TaxID=1325689 RepID=A0AAE3IXE1_9BACI|nr:NADPH dehydrogenase NamA [Perspicuibacillus lycopersici]MCU9613800.1 NADPH dehydrogenase NamA [Perspicuibacillus lycopersici]
MTIKLFEPYTIKNVTLPNRIVMSPMCMYSSNNEDGKVLNWHRTHYASRAVGQVGLIMVEATAVTAQGRITTKDLGIWDDQHIEGLTELVQLMKEHGSKTGIQLAHAGRKADLPSDIVAPSPIAFSDRYQTPKELTKSEIQEIVDAFQKAASRAKAAGFDVIELHGAHGYLLNQFLSPLTNKRSDEYGGSLENRYRIIREVVDAVKSVWDGPLFVRISAAEYHEDGSKLDDFITIAGWLKEQGVDFIDVSTGGVVPNVKVPVYPGYQVKLAEKIRENAAIPVGAVGLITSPVQAEEILQNERADLVFIARELLRNPYWPYQAAKTLGHSLKAPVPYERGWL